MQGKTKRNFIIAVLIVVVALVRTQSAGVIFFFLLTAGVVFFAYSIKHKPKPKAPPEGGDSHLNLSNAPLRQQNPAQLSSRFTPQQPAGSTSEWWRQTPSQPSSPPALTQAPPAGAQRPAQAPSPYIQQQAARPTAAPQPVQRPAPTQTRPELPQPPQRQAPEYDVFSRNDDEFWRADKKDDFWKQSKDPWDMPKEKDPWDN